MADVIVSRKPLTGNPKGEQEASLWTLWWNAIVLLRPAFSHTRAFLWFAVVVAGLTIRPDLLGVSSIVRAFNLKPIFYHALLRNFHSKAVCVDELSFLWATIVSRIFPAPLRINGRRIIVGDGIKIAKRGKKMPGVKLLHQQSENKAEFIMGHSLQAVSLLVHAAQSVVAVPLAARIHEGIVLSNFQKKTLLDKMLGLLNIVACGETFYFVGDAYYAARTITSGLLANGNHVITRVRSNAVAYIPYRRTEIKKRGRPRIYGEKIMLASLFRNRKEMREAVSPVYGEHAVVLQYLVRDLLWKPAGRIVRFVIVVHPVRGSCLLMSTDTTLDAVEIIRLYGLRFKIEHSFKQAVHRIGSFAYHFWMRKMKPRPHGSGNQYLHRETPKYRNAVERKVRSYHAFIQAGVVAQGLAQYLAVAFPEYVWKSFGSWLRTIRPGIAPSELVVAEALRNSLPHFLMRYANHHAFAKFIAQRQDAEKMEMFRLAA